MILDAVPAPQSDSNSLSYITKLGREFYLASLREKLEQTDYGKYVVIEPMAKEYFLNEDLMVALNDAEEKFPEKLFYIVKVGALSPPANNYVHQRVAYAW